MPQIPISGCSKGSRGLSVLPRVLGIFTETLISPSPSLRQRSSRYAIRAGRNFALIPCFQRRRLSLHLTSARRRSSRARRRFPIHLVGEVDDAAQAIPPPMIALLDHPANVRKRRKAVRLAPPKRGDARSAEL